MVLSLFVHLLAGLLISIGFFVVVITFLAGLSLGTRNRFHVRDFCVCT